MKRTLRSQLLRTTIVGIVVFSPAYAFAGEAQYYFPKDDAAKSSDKSSSADAGKDQGGKSGKQSGNKQVAAGNKAGSVSATPSSRGGFRPDFDGTGGGGPAVAPVEGKKNPNVDGSSLRLYWVALWSSLWVYSVLSSEIPQLVENGKNFFYYC